MSGLSRLGGWLRRLFARDLDYPPEFGITAIPGEDFVRLRK